MFSQSAISPGESSSSVIMACHFTGIYDVNRTTILADDDYTLVKDWVESLVRLRLNGILFHNNFSEATCLLHQNTFVRFIKVDYNPLFNPNVYRYFVYLSYLKSQSFKPAHFFITDITDVEVLLNPFEQPLFKENLLALFCGDEPRKLNNDWMKAHAELLRHRIPDYSLYEEKFSEATLLNCGIIGGHYYPMFTFIENICALHQQYNFDNTTQFTGDMGAFNYLVRTQFNNLLFHGPPVNTLFKAYEYKCSGCWFRHK